MSEIAPGSVVLGRYRVVRQLGAGGMGVVYLAEHLADGRNVVIKTIRDHLAQDAEVRARFVREAVATQTLRHRHIVDVLEASDAPPLLVLEHLEGESLHQYLQRHGPLPEQDTVRVATQLLDAFAVAHRANLVHRDLKPGNVMVVAGPHIDGKPISVKLLDFGLSHVLDHARLTRLTQTGQILGTPGYLAPEQALARQVDARTDLYALGVTLYRCLAGRAPFEGSPAALLRAVIQDAPSSLLELRPGIDPRLAATVHRALEKDPSRRFQSAKAMRDALRPPSTGRWVSIAAVAGVATAALTAGLLAWLEPAPRRIVRPVQPVVASSVAVESVPSVDQPSVDQPSMDQPSMDGPRVPRMHGRTRMQTPDVVQEPTSDPGTVRPGRFELDLPPVDNPMMRSWWRLHEPHLAHCFAGVTSSEPRPWSVTFSAGGQVLALAAGGANLPISACALNAVRRPPVPFPLRGRTIEFRVRWIPPAR